MEGDEIQRQVGKFQKISCNGSSVISESSSNPNKIATQIGNHLFPVGTGGGDGGGDGGVGRLCGWPSSRIVRVSRASGGKDRHSKVLTSKGLRDRRIRLSVSTAIEFYDLQDRLGYDQPSKAVEWLIKAASSSIDELPSLDPSYPGGGCHSGNHHQEHVVADNNSKGRERDFEDPNQYHHQHQNHQHNNSNSNSNNNNAYSSASDTSKGSGLSLSRSENRIRASERARDLAAKKDKVKESGVVSSISSSFTDLLTNPHMEYFQMPQFNNIPTGENQHQQQDHQFHFLLQGSFAPVVNSGDGGMSSGSNRGTLQSNLVSVLPHHQHLQRSFQAASMVDGSTSANVPFFMTPTISSGGSDHFQASGYGSQGLQLYGGGGDGGGRHSDHYKEKSKN